ncbi:MAG: hypothetical protein ACI9U2_004704 [Bradymonadia bacterium]|jgi:hypothetical protein
MGAAAWGTIGGSDSRPGGLVPPLRDGGWLRVRRRLVLFLALPACGGGDDDDVGPAEAATDMHAESGQGGMGGMGGAGGAGGMGGAGGSASFDYAGESNVGTCALNPQDASRYAVVGFWRSDDCSGDPIATNAFPINSTAACCCWPGNSGENSADGFECDPDARTVSLVRYNSLNCGDGDNTPTVKVFHVDDCRQDIPPTLCSRVIDLGPCR